jgi:hypothetical protein
MISADPWLQSLVEDSIIRPLNPVMRSEQRDILRRDLRAWLAADRSYFARYYEKHPGRDQLIKAFSVLSKLEQPDREFIPLSELAVREFGSDHALDSDTIDAVGSVTRSILLSFFSYRQHLRRGPHPGSPRNGWSPRALTGLAARRVFLGERLADGMISSVVTFVGASTRDARVLAAMGEGLPCTLTLFDILEC